MNDYAPDQSLEIATRWCASKGPDWKVCAGSGSGGTSSVFIITTPHGERALKVLSEKFSSGELGEETARRIELEKTIGNHNCPYLVKVFDGGKFGDRLFVLMSVAPGKELEKCLADVPRKSIRIILDQIAQAVEFLRSKGICHRDIKSSNIFVSDDFNHATLLDLSVSRQISDPVGMGTDHGGQLPVVATSRYSPPEYLFRLIAPSEELWYALDIYQLGGLLHDLLMREPMFEAEYKLSRDNRYRFAWIVATQNPSLDAPDADQDLVLLARRALDKDYKKRSTLQLDDFRDNARVQRAHGLAALGLGTAKANVQLKLGKPELIRTATRLTRGVETRLLKKLREGGVTATHEIRPGPVDTAKQLILCWDIPNQEQDGASLRDACLTANIAVHAEADAIQVALNCALTAKVAGSAKTAAMALPIILEQTELEEQITNQIVEALGDLARSILKSN